MLERLSRDARGTVRRAQLRARVEGAATVEAQDLLLALAETPSGPAGRALVSLGMTEKSLNEGLDREFASALAAVGVHGSLPLRLRPPLSGRAPTPRWGQSAKLALKRTLHEATRRRDRTLTSEHLLLGIVSLQAGVVPRLLEELQITPAQLRAALG
jgi:ATP-dependent Clp protease ATP-binding subunit ClpA